jgi:hypothetical protein
MDAYFVAVGASGGSILGKMIWAEKRALYEPVK